MAKRNRWPMISHERYFNNLEYMESIGITKGALEHGCSVFQCDIPLQQDLDLVPQYKIPYLFEQEMVRQFSSRFDTWIYIMQNNYEPLYNLLDSMLEDIAHRFKEPIEGIVAYFAPESLKRVAAKREISLFFNEGGLMRPPAYHTLLMYMGRDYMQANTANAEKRYKQFLQERGTSPKVPILSRKEIVMLFLSEEYQNDIDLIDSSPEYEIGLLHQAFYSMFAVQHTHMTNQELSLNANKLYEPSQIITRGNPNHGMQTDGSTSFHFICKCRRIVGVSGNMLLEAMLIGRIPCAYTKFQFSFMCNEGMSDPNMQPVPLEFVNFLVFCNYIPIEWMADEGHLRFLASNPPEYEMHRKLFTYFVSRHPQLKRKYLEEVSV